MLFMGMFDRAADALQYFALKRTKEGSRFVGVEGPSQVRYVHYFAQLMSLKLPSYIPDVPIHLWKLVMRPYDGMRRPYLSVHVKDRKVFYGAFQLASYGGPVVVDLRSMRVSGDVRMQVEDATMLGSNSTILYFYFHTYFVNTKEEPFRFKRDELDIACKDTAGKRFSSNFAVDLYFG